MHSIMKESENVLSAIISMGRLVVIDDSNPVDLAGNRSQKDYAYPQYALEFQMIEADIQCSEYIY
jgi:hypothetical protein